MVILLLTSCSYREHASGDSTKFTVTGISSEQIPVQLKKWTWNCNNPPCTFRHAINIKPIHTFTTESFSQTATATQNTGDGTHYLHVQAQNENGKVSAIKTVSFIMDNTVPTILGLAHDTTPTRSKTWSWNCYVNKTCTYIYAINTKTWNQDCSNSENFTYRYAINKNSSHQFSAAESFHNVEEVIHDTGNGIYYLHVQAQDTARNKSDILTVSVLMDNTPPIISGLADDPTVTYSKIWNWSCNEENCTYRYIINKEESHAFTTEPFSNTVKASKFLEEGTYYLHIQAKDAVGNISSTLSFSTILIRPTLGQYKGINIFNGLYVGLLAKPSLIDISRDGKTDLIIGNVNGTIQYYQGTDAGFEEKVGDDNPFNAINVGRNSAPTFANLDDDGELELVIGNANGNLKYYDLVEGQNNIWTWTERKGSGDNPNPFHDIKVGYDAVPTFADLDDDPDLELVIGNGYGTLHYYDLVKDSSDDNTWTWKRKTNSNNPFHNIDIGENSTPTFANLDTDTDLELIIGGQDGTIKYYDLSGTMWNKMIYTKNPFRGVHAGGPSSSPVFANLDNDPGLELVVGTGEGILKYYDSIEEFNNNSSTLHLKWVHQTNPVNPFKDISLGWFAYPSFANLDNDDPDPELIVGTQYGSLKYFDQINGKWMEQEDQKNNPFYRVNIGLYSGHTFANLDSDPQLELVIGTSSGHLKYYDLVGSSSKNNSNIDTWRWIEQQNLNNPFSSIDVGDRSTPVFADVDNDKKLELVIGDAGGGLHYYDLEGKTWNSKIGPGSNPFDDIKFQDDPTPFFVNLDIDPELELIIGGKHGNLSYYNLEGNTWTEKVGEDNPFHDVNVNTQSVPVFVNIDKDPELELVIGNKHGRLTYGDRYQEEWLFFK